MTQRNFTIDWTAFQAALSAGHPAFDEISPAEAMEWLNFIRSEESGSSANVLLGG